MNLKRRPRVFLGLACLILIAEVLWAQERQAFQWLVRNDFIEYWSAGQFLREGHNPTDSAALHELQQALGRVGHTPLTMWNPPWLLVLLYPLLLLPFPVAVTVWLGLSLVILLGCTVLTWDLFVPWTSPTRLLVPLLTTVVSAPVFFALSMGQVSVLLLLGIVGFVHFERKGRYFWAGAFLVLLTIKPHVTYLLWIAIAWWIVARGRGKVLWGFASTLLVLCGLLTLSRPTWPLDYGSAVRHRPLYWQAPVLGTALRILFVCGRTWLQHLPALICAPLVLIALHRRRAAVSWRDTASSYCSFQSRRWPMGGATINWCCCCPICR
jgi:hypothetical protein